MMAYQMGEMQNGHAHNDEANPENQNQESELEVKPKLYDQVTPWDKE